ncbi:hypothetical protein Dtox_1304 [Desulfofarcimen acetoxidans DSM 771]|uniref:Restriction endonuclease type IV Mrr domain-containing protein n=1 Tax=Desulfofarcimen acetoxidans (strain ATCC 49208 / DSM 771 / KCTC 5769 / VKM B-1644 / 5575) TaxID=485916 RepID=C8W697_DESAS|nr:restriction endonuclease [Desulfofarcimen acetoxidans]ACV62186.1 hypothetical protein Dtox_1304 [Desulfofarcimen acetoxidans DSM 771]
MKRDNYIKNYIHYRENQKTALARQIEFVSVLLVLWICTALIMLSIWGYDLTVLALTFIILLGEYKLLSLIRQIKLEHRLNRYKIWLSGKKCQQSIDETATSGEFQQLVQEILENTSHFSKVKVNKSKVKTHGIDLTAQYKNLPVVVRCEKTTDQENKISIQCLHEMVDDLDKLGMKNGIIVTNGIFGNKSRAAAEKYKKDYAITLIDRYNLIEYARKANHKIFPAPHIVEQLITERQEQKSADLIPLSSRLIGDRHKAAGYFTAASILGFMYYLINNISFFSIIYLLFALVNVTLGIMCLLHGKSRYELTAINIIDTGKEPG